VERICPYLALAADQRTVVDGYDPEHECRALASPDALDRARQVSLCLTEAHRSCERFAAAEAARLASEPRLPRLAPDAVVASTRLILAADPSWRTRGARAAGGALARRRLIGTGVAVLGASALVVGAAGGLLGVLAPPQTAVQPSPTPAETSAPTPTAPLLLPLTSPSATSTPTPRAAATARPSKEPGRPSTQAGRTYVVAAGDTLSGIANRFGTSVSAIQAANGLSGDVINIGQVLQIP
jgi:LysM repeat protein